VGTWLRPHTRSNSPEMLHKKNVKACGLCPANTDPRSHQYVLSPNRGVRVSEIVLHATCMYGRVSVLGVALCMYSVQGFQDYVIST
jgi:hypothetical protein